MGCLPEDLSPCIQPTAVTREKLMYRYHYTQKGKCLLSPHSDPLEVSKHVTGK